MLPLMMFLFLNQCWVKLVAKSHFTLFIFVDDTFKECAGDWRVQKGSTLSLPPPLQPRPAADDKGLVVILLSTICLLL